MTHGEDPSPETHEHSAVLTYLEGLLMHPVEAGPGATAAGRSEGVHTAGGRSEGVRRHQEQADKVRAVFQHHELAAPPAGSDGPALGSSQHLKKARLLQSGAWNHPLAPPAKPPAVELRGRGEELQNGSLEASRQAGESTLLASLLQSFSSRLQSVAMSQQPHPAPGQCSPPPKAPAACQGSPQPRESAAGHLKGLVRKSKHAAHGSPPYSHRAHSQDRPPASPKPAHRSTPPSASSAAEPVSCAERLKAVADLVKTRSSPAPSPSPKPSVACSQLALLLSSEAHFQQYSRVHALKAHFSGRCASERLAAIANQQQGQDQRPPSAGGTPSPTAAQTGLTETAPATVAPEGLRGSSSPPSACGRSQSPPPGPQPGPGRPSRERRGFDWRPGRPPQTCSSLLLLLLNNHSSQQQLTRNGHLQDACGPPAHSCSSSVTSDSESSQRDRSWAKDSSDGESCHSSCSPMDLSVRSRAGAQEPGLLAGAPASTLPPSSSRMATSSAPLPLSSSALGKPPAFSPCSRPFSAVASVIPPSSSSSSLMTSSLDKLTESLIKRWKPEPSASRVLEQEPNGRTELKSPPKVTLMQLLLERRHTEAVQRGPGQQDGGFGVSRATGAQGQTNGFKGLNERRVQSPLDKAGAPAPASHPFGHYPGSALASFPYLSPHVQSSPLDLCKSKSTSPEAAPQPAFSASKMLQDLAQSSSSASPPILSSKGPAQELEARRPLNPLESPGAVAGSSSTTPLSDRPSSCGTPSLKEELLPSQIENLLERRTVLQLLLGTASGAPAPPHKSRFSGSGRGPDAPAGGPEGAEGRSLLHTSAHRGPPSVEVKMEVTQEGEQAAAVHQDSAARRASRAGERTDSVPDLCPSVKKESHAENASRYGLLSQLLKQQSAAYYSNTAQARARPIPGEPFHQARPVPGEPFHVPGEPFHIPGEPFHVPGEHFHVPGEHFHVPSPKRRRLCPSQADAFSPVGPSRAAEGEDRTPFCSPLQEDLRKQREVKEDETPVQAAAGDALAREGQGFNVLKQLLLSDNCLKELSQQSQETACPPVPQAASKAPEAGLSQPAHEQGSPRQRGCHPHASLNSGLQSQLEAPPKGTAGDALRLHHTQHLRTLVKQEPRGDRWTSPGTESPLDSPQLSRSNPILYYMLQKGSIHLRKRLREPKDQSIKEEPASQLHHCEGGLSAPAPPHSLQLKHSRQNRGLS